MKFQNLLLQNNWTISTKLGAICLCVKGTHVFINKEPFKSQKDDNYFFLLMLWNNHSFAEMYWLGLFLRWSVDVAHQARRQEFPEGGSSTRLASRAPREARCSYGRGFGVFGAKSWNLAISKYFIQTFGKSCFSNLIIWFSPNFTPI